ncbi:hypothetical protein Tco_0363247 [Tanacetum coccineum]
MDILSLVLKYLNGMEDILDDGDSMEARKLTVGKSKEELELVEALDHKSVIFNGSHRAVVFTKEPPRAYSKPFTRFSLPCDVHGQVIRYANEGEPSILFGRDFLVTSKSRVNFGISKMRIDLTMLEETTELDAILDALVRILERCLGLLAYCLFMNLGLGDPKPYNSNLTIADNTQAKAMGEVKNVRIQIGYQAYLVDFLILDIHVDKELPLLLGRPFLRTCGAIIDMGCDSIKYIQYIISNSNNIESIPLDMKIA